VSLTVVLPLATSIPSIVTGIDDGGIASAANAGFAVAGKSTNARVARVMSSAVAGNSKKRQDGV
jgi:hypothetical protein